MAAIMMARTQITLDSEMLKRARRRASELGVSVTEYFRQLVVQDLNRRETSPDINCIFDLGSSGGSTLPTIRMP